MQASELEDLLKRGEDSMRQFKAHVTSANALAAEMVAFSNTRGGMLILGVDDAGNVSGIDRDDMTRVNLGTLPNSLTIENIRYGNSAIRNPIIASFAAKMLPYRGLGSGVIRALREQPNINFEEDREGEQFKVIIPRPEV